MSTDDDAIDPGLRRTARLLRRVTPRTPEGYRRQARVLNAVTARRRTPGVGSSRVRGDVEVAQRWTTRRDGTPLRLLLVRPAVPRRGVAGVVWIHGGGYAIGTPEQSRATARRLVAATDCVVVLPDYRLSTRAPYPAALDDCYDALLWLRAHAGELGVADDQLVVGGESAGAGLTVAVALRARDRGEVAVAFQLPLYPMLDDRPTASSRDNHAPVWNTATNEGAWDLYLGDLRGGEVPAEAAPSRAADLGGLPPTLTFVGDVEPFHDEVVDFVRRLEAAGVPVLHRVYRGAFHGFDLVAPSARLSREARAFLLDGFRAFSAAHRTPQPGPAAGHGGAAVGRGLTVPASDRLQRLVGPPPGTLELGRDRAATAQRRQEAAGEGDHLPGQVPVVDGAGDEGGGVAEGGPQRPAQPAHQDGVALLHRLALRPCTSPAGPCRASTSAR